MNRRGKQLTTQLIKLRNAIKRKYRLLKEGDEASDILLEKQYKPIVTELRKNTVIQQPEIKQEPKEEEESLTDDDDYERSFNPQSVSSPSTSIDASQYIDQRFRHPLTNEYMKLVIKDSGNRIDNTYGPRYDGGRLMVGNKPLSFDEHGNIKIGKASYGNSQGLYELLFKRIPEQYNDDDLNTYKTLLIATSAHKRGYGFRSNINRNTSTKYKRIIIDLFPIQGKGMMWKSAKPRDIMHWDDPNELIDRLRHLAMSTEAGNGSHKNEIINIVEELREAGYIKGSGNSRYKSLIK